VPATNGVLPHDLGDGEEHVAVDAGRRARLQRERDQPGGASASCGLTPGAQELPSRAGRARGRRSRGCRRRRGGQRLEGRWPRAGPRPRGPTLGRCWVSTTS